MSYSGPCLWSNFPHSVILWLAGKIQAKCTVCVAERFLPRIHRHPDKAEHMAAVPACATRKTGNEM